MRTLHPEGGIGRSWPRVRRLHGSHRSYSRQLPDRRPRGRQDQSSLRVGARHRAGLPRRVPANGQTPQRLGPRVRQEQRRP